MRYLLDTNVLSELTRPRCEPRVLDWLNSVDEDETYVSVMSVAELRQGIEFLPKGKRRDALNVWLQDDLLDRYRERLIDVTVDVANMWGALSAGARAAGGKMPAVDGIIAATAHVHSLIVATRDTRDFEPLGVKLLNPWNP